MAAYVQTSKCVPLVRREAHREWVPNHMSYFSSTMCPAVPEKRKKAPFVAYVQMIASDRVDHI